MRTLRNLWVSRRWSFFADTPRSHDPPSGYSPSKVFHWMSAESIAVRRLAFQGFCCCDFFVEKTYLYARPKPKNKILLYLCPLGVMRKQAYKLSWARKLVPDQAQDIIPFSTKGSRYQSFCQSGYHSIHQPVYQSSIFHSSIDSSINLSTIAQTICQSMFQSCCQPTQ